MLRNLGRGSANWVLRNLGGLASGLAGRGNGVLGGLGRDRDGGVGRRGAALYGVLGVALRLGAGLGGRDRVRGVLSSRSRGGSGSVDGVGGSRALLGAISVLGDGGGGGGKRESSNGVTHFG